jgi:ABC transporter substrate binding protein
VQRLTDAPQRHADKRSFDFPLGTGIEHGKLSPLDKSSFGDAFHVRFEGLRRARVVEIADQGRVRGLVVGPDAFLITRQKQIIELAAEQRLPTIYATRGAVVLGGLMSYGALTNDLYRAAGVYAGRILRGATSAALPVMPPARFEFVINKTTADELRKKSKEADPGNPRHSSH